MSPGELVKKTRLDKADYSLLEIAEDARWPVYVLNLPNMDGTLNKHHHGLCESELTDRILGLWRSGWIECMSAPFRTDFAFERTGCSPVVVPDDDILRLQFRHPAGWAVGDETLFYGLTSAGAAVWEALTVVDWSKCLNRNYDRWDRDCKTMTISGSDRDLVQRAFAVQKLHGAFELAVPGTETWSTSEPWAVRYWKSFPLGYRLSFRFEWFEDRRGTDDDLRAHTQASLELQGLERWRKSFEEVCTEYF
jgi:hypothetical protein